MRSTGVLVLALAAAGSATEALRERDVEIRAAFPPRGETISEAERRRVEAIVARIVDTGQMLESALGPRWAALTEEERQRLLVAFERRFRTLGAAELESLREAKIEYLPERIEGPLVIVPTRVRSRDRTDNVSYAMRETASGWRIVDMVVDDVSMVGNYRTSFMRVIRRDGVDALIRRLEGSVDR